MKLLEPGTIGTLRLKNRIIMAPMGTGFAGADGSVSERLIVHYETRARGGCGLVICGVLSVDAPRGNNLDAQVAISDDSHLPGLSRLTEAVHRHGARIAAQLVHGGKLAVGDMIRGVNLVSPSESRVDMKETLRDLTRAEFEKMVRRFAAMGRGMKTEALTADDIQVLAQRFAEAAARAQVSGFDGVEIHAGHGYLISSFLSPAANRREDEYGGELKNRARFLLEIIAATRKKVGSEYPVWCRIDCREFGIKNGITPDDGRQLAVMLEEAGIDAVHVSGYGGTIGGFIDAPLVYPPGNLVPYAAEIKKSVRIPVIAVGRIDTDMAERLLREDRADFIAMGRPLLTDPELPLKLASGKPGDIRPCIYCYHCVSRHLEGEATVCTVNPAVGRDAELTPVLTGKKKTVVVIGGGPAGLEAARVAALRGHRVTILEKERRLGGSLVFASVANSDMEPLLDWLAGQVRRLPIDIRLGSEARAATVRDLAPDAVVIATGPSFTIPHYKTDGSVKLFTGPELRAALNGIAGKGFSGLTGSALSLGRPVIKNLSPHTVRRLTQRWLPIGKNVAVIGGDLVAVELADFLSSRGRNVTLLNEQRELAAGMTIPARWRILKQLRKSGVSIVSDIRIEEIAGGSVTFAGYGGDSETVTADTVIIAGTAATDDALYEELKGIYPEVYRIGDCAGERLLRGSIEDGARTGLSI